MKKPALLALSVACFTCFNSIAEVKISGFATVAGGKVISGDGLNGSEPSFLANYPLVAVYEEDWSFKPETRMGLQLSADLLEGLSVTGQIVSRGADDFDAKFEWAYLSYRLNDHWTLQAGKKRLPLYYYSDFFDVGYAYLWLRPPADNYTWQIFNYDGINALFNYQLGSWDLSGNLYYGREDDKRNKLLSDYFFGVQTREIWKDITGLVLNFNRDWLDIRLTYMTYVNERFFIENGVSTPASWGDRRGRFYGSSFNIDYNNLIVLTELNRLDLDGENFDTYMVSFGYRLNQITPFLSYADFDSESERHHTTSAGLRYDFHKSAAFKLQFDRVKDKGTPGYEVAGDSNAITLGVDLVF